MIWYLYLDESGDLGLDFEAKQPSRLFTIILLLIKGQEANRKLIGLKEDREQRPGAFN